MLGRRSLLLLSLFFNGSVDDRAWFLDELDEVADTCYRVVVWSSAFDNVPLYSRYRGLSLPWWCGRQEAPWLCGGLLLLEEAWILLGGCWSLKCLSGAENPWVCFSLGSRAERPGVLEFVAAASFGDWERVLWQIGIDKSGQGRRGHRPAGNGKRVWSSCLVCLLSALHSLPSRRRPCTIAVAFPIATTGLPTWHLLEITATCSHSPNSTL